MAVYVRFQSPHLKFFVLPATINILTTEFFKKKKWWNPKIAKKKFDSFINLKWCVNKFNVSDQVLHWDILSILICKCLQDQHALRNWAIENGQRAFWSQIYSPGKTLFLSQKKNNWLWMQIASNAHPGQRKGSRIRREDPEGFFEGYFVCICVCLSVYLYRCPQGPKEGIRSPGPKVIGGRELPIVGAGSRTWVLARAAVPLAPKPPST